MGWLTRDGVRLYHKEEGHGDPPLLLIHGGGCDYAHFAPQYTHFRDDMAWLCEQLNLREPTLIGHSMGGKVALELAVRYPGLPAAVVAVESSVLPSQPAAGVASLSAALRTPDFRAAAREFFERALFLPTDDPERKAKIVEQMAATPQHVLASAFANTVAWDGAAAATACQVPFLLISGAVVVNDLAHLMRLCPHLVHGQTVGAGHFNQLEVPDQVNAMIERFLAISLPRPAA